MISRRAFLAGVAATASAPVAAAEPATLASAARRAGLIFGASVDDSAFADPAYVDLYRRETQMVVTDVALKFDWLRPAQDIWNFGPADRIVAAAKAEGKLVRGHTLIWNDNAPAWLKRLSGREVERVFDEHIDRVVARYAGALHSWDVVNEPFFPPHGREGGYRKGAWLEAMGPSYIERAFARAAAADPSAQLVLNEAFCEQDDELGRAIRPLLFEQVRRMKAEGVKIDAVGFEAHLKPHLPFDDAAFAAYVASIADLGVDILITELDVDDSAMPDDLAARDAAVAARVGAFLDAVLTVPRVRAVITWHLSDRYSWYRGADWYAAQVAGSGGSPGRPVRSHLFDADLAPKAAAVAAADSFARSAPR